MDKKSNELISVEELVKIKLKLEELLSHINGVIKWRGLNNKRIKEIADAIESKEHDELYRDAKALAVKSKEVSASLLQRRLNVGYARAVRLLDLLEEEGMIGPGEGARPRKVIKNRNRIK
jgi:DNA segregation ATPase FtsK/SpoIIIE-like protein